MLPCNAVKLHWHQQRKLYQKKQNKKVVAYGAAAKGNTLLNYCGVKNDLIEFVVDASPHKQGKYLPGNHIPIVNEEIIKEIDRKNKSIYISAPNGLIDLYLE